MQRMFVSGARRAYSVSSRVLAAEATPAATGTNLVLNFCTPHTPIHQNKVVDKVILPGESGEYGVTVGHSPIISQLKPGVVTVIHTAVCSDTACLAGRWGFFVKNKMLPRNFRWRKWM
jgi:hypothetical protein